MPELQETLDLVRADAEEAGHRLHPWVRPKEEPVTARYTACMTCGRGVYVSVLAERVTVRGEARGTKCDGRRS